KVNDIQERDSSVPDRMTELLSHNSTSPWNWSAEENRFRVLDELDLPAEGSVNVRILVCAVYALVCVTGLAGNLLVFVLMTTRMARRKSSSVNLLVCNLAVTDFQFVLTLPFWAAETALDFSWPFGDAMCKIVLSVTVVNMYASVFFLTAMGVTRYLAVTSVLQRSPRRWGCAVRWVVAALWACALLAALPTVIFSAARSVSGEQLCLLSFPAGPSWLALHHLQKVLVAFLIPMLVLTVCYLLLLRSLRLRSRQRRRGSTVTRSVTVVVLSFFICWMPNQAITFWGVLEKLHVVRLDKTYYFVHTYVHPLSVCLAYTNSCLNPLLYCLMRPDFREKMRELFWRRLGPTPGTGGVEPGGRAAVPLNNDNSQLSGSIARSHTDALQRLSRL
uniref:Relaxin family peptide receptor 3.3b n=1 Tax=Oryzias sinensis TaxID=183150 RepID=A0A8C7Z8M4_9TELE